MIKIIKILIALVMVCQLFSCGLVAKNGLVKEGENTYYYLNDKKQTGWQEIDGDWYYFFNGNYTMAHNTLIVDVNGKDYFLDYNGKMCKNEVKPIESFKYRIDKDGTPVALGAIKETAYFGEDGAMLKNTQKDWGGKIYIIDEKGLAKEAPYYSAKALAGGTYNFYLENIFPLYIEYYPFMSGYGTWIIREKPIIEVFYNSVRISGIVESKNIKSLEDFSQSCRLSMVDEQGITSSIERYAKSNKIYSGEKTRFEINFNDCLPLYGNNIYVRFVE